MSRQTELRWVANVVAAEGVRDYSDTALMLYGVRLGSVSFPLLGTKLPSRVSAAPRQKTNTQSRNSQKFSLPIKSLRQYVAYENVNTIVKSLHVRR